MGIKNQRTLQLRHVFNESPRHDVHAGVLEPAQFGRGHGRQVPEKAAGLRCLQGPGAGDTSRAEAHRCPSDESGSPRPPRLQGQEARQVVDYAVSESRAMDVLEDICKNIKDYSKSSNPDGTVQLVKMNNNDGEPVSFSGSMDFGGDDGGKLQNKCETLLEEYEEEITEHIRLKPTEALEASICTDTAKKCPKPKIEKLEKEL